MALVFAPLILTLSCEHKTSPAPAANSKPEPSTAPSIERPCHLNAGGQAVSLASEIGQPIQVPSGTKCSVLDAGDALTRVRITEGAFKDAVAWTKTGAVVVDAKGR